MKKLFTLTILIYSFFITQIYAQKKAENSIATISESDIQNSKINEKPFIQVDVFPQFPGGEAALLKFIKENLKCPKSISDNCIQGQVIVSFVVSADGSVKDVQVLRSLDPACDKEAIRLIESLPKWIPSKQNGKAVDVYYTVPVRFKIEI